MFIRQAEKEEKKRMEEAIKRKIEEEKSRKKEKEKLKQQEEERKLMEKKVEIMCFLNQACPSNFFFPSSIHFCQTQKNKMHLKNPIRDFYFEFFHIYAFFWGRVTNKIWLYDVYHCGHVDPPLKI